MKPPEATAPADEPSTHNTETSSRMTATVRLALSSGSESGSNSALIRTGPAFRKLTNRETVSDPPTPTEGIVLVSTTMPSTKPLTRTLATGAEP